MAVSIVRTGLIDVNENLKKALKLIGYKPRKKKILLKPNAASHYGHYLLGDYTSPQVLEAFIRLFPAQEIVIAEACGVGMDFKKAFETQGYKRLAKKYTNVSLLDLENAERKPIKWKYGTIDIPKIIKTHEYVNVPKLKTHHLTGVTLGLKNQKGIINEATKKKFHRLDIHDAIYQLGKVVQPALTIIDGIIALEGNGPNSIIARPKLMNILICGSDIFEVDNVGCQVMGMNVEKVKHIPRHNVEVVGEKISHIRQRFEKPHFKEGYLNVANIFYTLGCSGCLESLSGALRMLIKFPYIIDAPRRISNIIKNGVIGRLYVFMGTNIKHPKKRGRMVCIGNCSSRFANEHKLDYIKGCPPKPAEIMKIFD